MPKITVYSDSEEFLMGYASGTNAHADTETSAEMNPITSDNSNYELMLTIIDGDSNQSINHFYNGSSLDYIEGPF
jgi:hypothetical protein